MAVFARLQACAICAWLLNPVFTVAQTLTSDPTGTVYCNGSEVIFTCETRGSATLEWHDGFYLGGASMQISFAANLHPINTRKMSLSNADTVATLTHNYLDGGVRVMVSTLHIVPLSVTPTGNVRCVRDNGTESQIHFQVLATPIAPQVVTFQSWHDLDMCTITSVLQSPTNPNATTYTVNVDGSSVPYRNAEIISTDGIRRSALLYEASCAAHRISIYAINMCGQGPGTMFNVNFGGASSTGCSVATVLVSVVLAVFLSPLDLTY